MKCIKNVFLASANELTSLRDADVLLAPAAPIAEGETRTYCMTSDLPIGGTLADIARN